MSLRSISLTSQLYDYLVSISVREPAFMRELREETVKLPEAECQIAPDQGQFMGLLASLIGAKRALEIGTFTGYSSLAIGIQLPADGEMVCCDLSEEWTNVAKKYWKKAGIDGMMELRLGPGLDSLNALIEEGKEEYFDLAFIDADKTNYVNYYEKCLRLIRPGGVIMFDNMFLGGGVINPAHDYPEIKTIRKLNEMLHSDDRIDLSLVPIGDGLTIARKR